MELRVVEDYAALSRAGAAWFAGALAAEPHAALVLATGNTPLGLYAELVAWQQRGALDLSAARVFQLDAYLGLAREDPRSLYGWLDRAFLTPLGVPEARVVALPGDTPDPEAACRAYDAAVEAAGGFGISVLGLGPNGHLGFNEPPSDPASPTRVVTLTAASIASNAGYWGGPGRVPRQALTAGMAVLLAARRTLLVVSGAHKRGILERVVQGPITPDVPASYLRQAANVTILADRAAWPGPVPRPSGQ
jgi:glucosamine-6-phosphate deaminase